MDGEDHGVNLRVYLDKRGSWFHGHDLEKWLADGRFRLNGVVIGPRARLDSGGALTLERPPWREPDAPQSLPVVFENEDLLAVDKPAGLPTVPTGDFYENTALSLLRRNTGNEALAPVHRLDIETSGLLLLAKRRETRGFFQSQFQRGEVDKRYRAAVFGRIDADRRVIDLPLGRDRAIYTKFVADPRGRPARTEIEAFSFWREYSLLELRPITGRTNQVRAHLAAIGHAIVGDKKYFPDPHAYLHWVDRRNLGPWRALLKLERQALCCAAMTLRVGRDGEPRRIALSRDPFVPWRRAIAEAERVDPA